MVSIPEEMIRSGKRTSVGSIVCKHKVIENGVPTLFLHTAIPMTLEQFRPNGAGERDFSVMNEAFSMLDTHMKKALFSYKGASAQGEYGVFTFSAPEGWHSLAEMTLPLKPQVALHIFEAVLKTIEEYRQCDVNDNGYRPLLFICPESVYVTFDPSGNFKDLQLLPMPYDPQAMYEGMPRELGRTQPDISADISMAAYLYLLIKYTADKPFDQAIYAQCDRLAEQCLSPFPQRRPSLEQLLAAVQNGEDTQAVSDKNSGESADDGYIIISGKDDTTAPVAPTRSEKPKRSIFGGKGSKKAAKPKKPKKKSAIVSAIGTVEDLFSTQAADEAEED